MTDLPIVCTLTPEALKARRAGLLSDLMRRARTHEELPQGYRLRFAAADDMLATILRIGHEGHRSGASNTTIEVEGVMPRHTPQRTHTHGARAHYCLTNTDPVRRCLRN